MQVGLTFGLDRACQPPAAKAVGRHWT
ncbi:MAG: hypothetical protein RL527_935, partial [Planctomycetota bacterium]